MNNNIFYHKNYLGNEAMYPIPDPIAPAKKPQIDYPQKGNGFKIGVTPGAVVGALVGGAIAKNQVQKAEQQRIINERNLLNKILILFLKCFFINQFLDSGNILPTDLLSILP